MIYGCDEAVVRLVYILLNIGMLAAMIYFGKKIEKNRISKYWQYATGIIIAYSVTMGLRFGRMIDYNIYYSRFERIGQNFSSLNYELFFRSICWAFYNIGVPYWVFVFLCSTALISSLMFLAKDYKNYIPLVCILFIWETHNAENFIRWYLAFSFFIYAFVFFKRGKYKQAVLFSALASLTHIGSLLLISTTLAINLRKKELLPKFVALGLFTASVLVGNTGLLNFLVPYTHFLGFDERSSFYVDQFSDIVQGEFGLVGFMNVSLSNKIRVLLAYSIPLLMLGRMIKEKLVSALDGNLFLVGAIVAPIFVQVEILNRYGEGFLFFSVVVSSATYGFIWNNRKCLPKQYVVFGAISFLANIWPVFSMLFSRNQWWTMLYIWDSGNLDTLPLYLFLR